MSCFSAWMVYPDSKRQYRPSIHRQRFKDVSVSDFNQQNISLFLRWLHDKRGNESTTINQRLSHIKGFCKYIQKKDILSFKAYSEICEIAEYKDERVKDFIWLTIEDVKLVLKQPDIKKKTGIRAMSFSL